MSHQLWVNKLRDPRLKFSSTNPSTSDQNENVHPTPILSRNSENNLEMFMNMGRLPAAVLPPVAENNRKRKASANPWNNERLFEEIDSLDSVKGLMKDLKNMDDIDAAFKENLLLTFDLLFGETGRRSRGHADQIATTEIKLKQKDTIIAQIEAEKKQLNEKLDEASREIGTQKAQVDVLEEKNKQLEDQNHRQIDHIKMVEEMIGVRNADNNRLVKQIHQIKHEKLVEHAENAAENRRKCEKLGIMMKHLHDVDMVNKRAAAQKAKAGGQSFSSST